MDRITPINKRSSQDERKLHVNQVEVRQAMNGLAISPPLRNDFDHNGKTPSGLKTSKIANIEKYQTTQQFSPNNDTLQRPVQFSGTQEINVTDLSETSPHRQEGALPQNHVTSLDSQSMGIGSPNNMQNPGSLSQINVNKGANSKKNSFLVVKSNGDDQESWTQRSLGGPQEFLPGISHVTTFVNDSKGNLGFAPKNNIQKQNQKLFYAAQKNKNTINTGMSSLQGLVGSAVSQESCGPTNFAARKSGPKSIEVDQILQQFRQRKTLNKGAHNYIAQNNQAIQLQHLNPLSPIKVTKIFTKQNEMVRGHVLTPNERQTISTIYDNKSGLNTEVVSNAGIHVDGDKGTNINSSEFIAHQRFGQPGGDLSTTPRLGIGSYLKNKNPLMLKTLDVSDLPRREQKRREYSSVKHSRPIAENPNEYSAPNSERGADGSNLPKIKQVFITPKNGMSIEGDIGNMRTSPVRRSGATAGSGVHKPRWKTPIGTASELQNLNLDLQNSLRDVDTLPRGNDFNPLNKTQDFLVFKQQSFTVSKFPKKYSPYDGSADFNSKRSPRSNIKAQLHDSAKFRFVFQNKRAGGYQCSVKNSVSIGATSRHQLMEQMQQLRHIKTRESKISNEEPSWREKGPFSGSYTAGTAAESFMNNTGRNFKQNESTPIGDGTTDEETSRPNKQALVQELQEMIGIANARDIALKVSDASAHNIDTTNEQEQELSQDYLSQIAPENKVAVTQTSIIASKVQSASAPSQADAREMEDRITNSTQKNISPPISGFNERFSPPSKKKRYVRGRQKDACASARSSYQSSLSPPLGVTNFYQDIESHPYIPLQIELQVQEQMRAIQKRIRTKKEMIRNQIKDNADCFQSIQENLIKRNKLYAVLRRFEAHSSHSHRDSAMTTMKSDGLTEKVNHQSITFCRGQSNGGFQTERFPQNNTQVSDQGKNSTVQSGTFAQALMHINQRSVNDSAAKLDEQETASPDKKISPAKFMNLLHQSSAEGGGATPKFDQSRNTHNFQTAKTEKSILIERQILSLYKDGFRNDFKREEAQTKKVAKFLRNQVKYDKLEISELKFENLQLNKTIKRYMAYIDNFKKDHKKFLAFKNRGGSQSPSPRNIMVAAEIVQPSIAESQECQISNNESAEGVLQTETTQTLDDSPSLKVALTFEFQKQVLPGKGEGSIGGSIIDSKMAEKVDINKIGKMMHQIKNACKQEKPIDFALNIIDLVKGFLQCSKVMLVPLDYFLGVILTTKKYNTREKMQFIHSIEFSDKSDGESKRLAVIARSENDVQSCLAFESIIEQDEPQFVIKDKMMGILFRECKENGGPSFILQVEYDNDILSASSTNLKQSKENIASKKLMSTQTTYAKKINPLEGKILQLLLRTAELKFERMKLLQQNKNSDNITEVTLCMVNELSNSNTLRGLMRTMNKVIMNYLGFQDINIMFHDTEKDVLYTITFGDDDEHNHKVKLALKKASSEKEKQDIKDKESMRDVTLNANQMILYPLHLGISAQVFSKQKTCMINDFKPSKNFDFVNEIDNPKGLKEIKNLLIGSLKREDGTSNGVIQLFNNTNPITKHDVQRFEAFSRFLGGQIEKIEDKTKKLTTVVAVEMAREDAKVAVDKSMSAVDEDGTITAYLNLMKPFEIMQGAIR